MQINHFKKCSRYTPSRGLGTVAGASRMWGFQVTATASKRRIVAPAITVALGPIDCKLNPINAAPTDAVAEGSRSQIPTTRARKLSGMSGSA